MSEVVLTLPEGLTILYVAAEDERLAAITVDADGQYDLFRAEGSHLERTRWPHRGTAKIAIVDGALVAQIDDRVARLVDGRLETIGAHAFAVGSRGIVTSDREGDLVCLPPDGTRRSLLTEGSFPCEIEIVERSGERFRVTVDEEGRYQRGALRYATSLRHVFGVPSLHEIAALATGVALTTVGGPSVLPEVRFVPWEGGALAKLVCEPDVGGASRWLGDIASYEGGLALVTGIAKSGGLVSMELWLLAPPAWTTPRKIPLGSSSSRGLASDGAHLVHVREIEGSKRAIDLLVHERWIELAREMTSVDLACTREGVVYGRGADIVRTAWASAETAPRPVVAELLAAIRAGGKLEKTQFGGKPAAKITRADGISGEDLADLERRLS